MYNGKKMYPAPGENLANQVALKNIDGNRAYPTMGTPRKQRRKETPWRKKFKKLSNINNNFAIKDLRVQGQESIIFCEWKRRAYVRNQGVRSQHLTFRGNHLLQPLKTENKKIKERNFQTLRPDPLLINVLTKIFR